MKRKTRSKPLYPNRENVPPEDVPSTSSTYERDRKRKYRAKTNKGKSKRGRKETIGVKHMSADEKRRYDNLRKKLSRARKKVVMEEANEPDDIENHLPDVDEDSDDTDFAIGNEQQGVATGSAILNIIANSPTKKKQSQRRLKVLD